MIEIIPPINQTRIQNVITDDSRVESSREGGVPNDLDELFAL